MTTQTRRRAAACGLAVVAIGTVVFVGWRLRQSHEESVRFREEAARLVDLLDLESGAMVADIGAGQGLWTVHLARHIGDRGHVYATAGPIQGEGLFEEVARSELRNISVLVEAERVPRGCCHALLVRRIFHHFEDPDAAASKLFQNLRAGGQAVIIDFDEGTSSYDEGHGIARRDVEDAMTRAGFELDQAIDDWSGGTYCLVFVRPPNEMNRTANR